MFDFKYLIITLLLLVSSLGKAQVPESPFNRLWQEMLAVDDNEKGYRYPVFVKSVEAMLSDSAIVVSEATLPGQWNFQRSVDGSYLVCSGVLPFDQQNHRLMYVVVEKHPKQSAHGFSISLDGSAKAIFKPTVEVTSSEFGLALRISNGAMPLLEIPDLELKVLFSKMIKARMDLEKEAWSKSVWKRLEPLMASEALFKNPLSGYKELSTQVSTDGRVKICTWNIETNEGVHTFFGGLAVKTPAGIKSFQLVDNSGSIRTPEQAVLTPSKWYGAMYYDIIESKTKGSYYYTLIGHNGHDAFSQIKVVDVLVLAEGVNPNPRFGHPFFADEKRTRRRLIYEYSKRATMMLRYDPSEKMIVMDNLAPVNPMYQNDFRHYGPDFSHNGLKMEKGKWVFQNELDLRNEEPPKR
jgi:hypothetical protein